MLIPWFIMTGLACELQIVRDRLLRGVWMQLNRMT